MQAHGIHLKDQVMGKLWVDRIIDIVSGEISDDADGPAVVVAHNEVQKAMSEIFSIPLGLNITTGIFENPDTFAGVNADGKISMMRFETSGIAGGGTDSCGLEFFDGNERKRLILVGSTLQIWKELANGTWEQVIDLEATIEGTLSGKVDAGPAVEDKDPPLGVLAVASNANEEFFTLVPNEVAETGRTEFLELTDVHDDFKNPHPVTSFPYDPALIGHGVIIGADDMLEPASIEDSDNSVYAFDLYTVTSRPLGEGTAAGSGEWRTMGPWHIESPFSDPPTLVTLSGQANGGVELGPGVYKLKPRFRMTSAGGGGEGLLMFRVYGLGFDRLPDSFLAYTEGKPFHYPNVPPGFDEDWWDLIESTVTPLNPFVAMDTMGLVMISVVTSAIVGLGMARDGGTVSVVTGMSVERIQ
jgi:hypothetical protein